MDRDRAYHMNWQMGVDAARRDYQNPEKRNSNMSVCLRNYGNPNAYRIETDRLEEESEKSSRFSILLPNDMYSKNKD